MKVVLVSAAACLFVILFAATAGWKIFLGFAAVVGLYALVVRLRQRKLGLRQRFLDDWSFEDGEVVIWRDDRADCGVIPSMGRASVSRPARWHMVSVVVTNRRVIVASLTLFTKRRAVVYVLDPRPTSDPATLRVDGGLFPRGYTTYVIQPGVMNLHPDSRPAYVALKPAVSVGASLGVAEIRIYSDLLQSFRLRLPGE